MESRLKPAVQFAMKHSKRDFIRMLKASRLTTTATSTGNPFKSGDEQNDPSASTQLPPLLRLPPDVRAQIFRHVIESELSDYGYNTRVIEFQEFTHNDNIEFSPKPNLLNVFLVNKLLRDEAEKALWRNYTLSLQAWNHYKYPLRESSILNLSPYAYANIKSLWIPLYVSRLNNFHAVKVSYNNIIGTSASRSSTWHYEDLAHQLVSLRTLYITVHESKDMRLESGFRGRCIETIVSMLGMFIANTIFICCESEETVSDLRVAARYRIEDFETRCRFTLSEKNAREWKIINLETALAPEKVSKKVTNEGDEGLEGFPYQTVVIKRSSTSTTPKQVVATVVTAAVNRALNLKTKSPELDEDRIKHAELKERRPRGGEPEEGSSTNRALKEGRPKTARSKTADAKRGRKAADVKKGSTTLEARNVTQTQEAKGGFFDSIWGRLKV